MRYVTKENEHFRFTPISDASEAPVGSVVITEDQFEEYFRRQEIGKQHGYNIVNGDFIYTEQEQVSVVTPTVDQSIADMWEAILTLSAKLDVLEGK